MAEQLSALSCQLSVNELERFAFAIERREAMKGSERFVNLGRN
jgi:hypothetical protein